MGKLVPVLLYLALLVFIVSCAGTGSADFPQMPPVPAPTDSSLTLQTAGLSVISDADQGNRYLWGYYFFDVDPEKGFVESIPLRNVSGHWNVLKFLEQGPCTNCVSVVKVTSNPSGTKSLDVKIKHPFPLLNLTGFDVRGIAMFKGSHTFPEAGLSTPDATAGDGELMNADGYTTLYNISTVGDGPGGLQGYLKGKFASPTAPDAKLNGYKRYITSNPANTRNAFYGGDEITETFEIKMPTSGFILGYAVDASWVPATVKPVTDPMNDFPPEANCPEPWKIDVTELPIDQGLTPNGGATVLVIDIYDWQGLSSYETPVIECPELFDGTWPATWSQDYAGYSEWAFYAPNYNLAPVGDYKCLVKVIDKADAGSPDWLDLTAYQIHKLTVSNIGGAWARTWGSTEQDSSIHSVTTDSTGNVYTVAEFQGTLDLDPGPGVDGHTSNGDYDVALSKFSPTGDFVWGVSWGGTLHDYGDDMAVDSNDGSIYVGGAFTGTADFDPGPGFYNVSSVAGSVDAYLLKLDESGSLVWVRSWGDVEGEDVKGIDVDPSGNVMVSGEYMGTVDFDPGSGESYGTSNGDFDAFLSEFDSGGNLIWADAWGGPSKDASEAVASGPSGAILVTGYFGETVDFNPGAGVENYTSAGSLDAFAVQFWSTGGWLGWARTWGGTNIDEGSSVDVDPNGYVVVAGQFEGTVDFNPSPVLEDFNTSNGTYDAFINVFDSSSAQRYSRTWGSDQQDVANGVRYYEDQSVGETRIAVTGLFGNTVDFDTGGGIANRVSNGSDDVFLTTFNQNGDWIYADTWGSINPDHANAVTSFDNSESLLVAGQFCDTVDFDPGVGVDNHTSNGDYDSFLERINNAGSW